MKKIYESTSPENNDSYRRRSAWVSAVSLLIIILFMTSSAWAEAVRGSEKARKTVEARISLDRLNLTCTGPDTLIELRGKARIDGVVNPEGTLFSWTGPNGFTSKEKNIGVSVSGTYILTVTDPSDGASDSRSMIIYGPEYPVGGAGPDRVLSAQSGTVTLSGDFSRFDSGGLWIASDGGHIVSGERTPNPVVDAPGTYTLTITSLETGCTIQDAVLVTSGSTAVDANAGPDKLHSCLTQTVQLEGSSSTPGATFSWVSAGEGFIRSGANTATPVVSGTGVYTLTVTANGASSSDQVQVVRPTLDALSSDGTYMVNCSKPSIVLDGESNLENAEFTWTGPNGFTASGRSITVTEGGNYAITVSSPSYECTVESVITIQEFKQAPGASAGPDKMLACNGAAVKLEGTSSSTKEMLDFQWYDSEMQRIQVGQDGRNLVVSSPGIYTLQVVDPLNGCISTDQVSVLPAAAQTDVTHHVIDFNSEQTGLISSVSTELGPISIMGRKRNKENAFSYSSENHAAIFDSQAPNGDDTDLYTADWGNVLIVNQDLTNVPNDNQWGGQLRLDFSAIGPVTMTSLNALDIDSYESDSWVYLYGAGEELIKKVRILPQGNNSKQTVDLGNTKEVMMIMIVLDGRDGSGHLAGSGAIDDIRFSTERHTKGDCPEEQASSEAISSVSAYPNPFSGKAKVEFRLRQDREYSVSLYDIKGNLVRELKAGEARNGELITVDVDGEQLREGLYIARIVSIDGSKIVKLLLKK